jgi:hypothetical protein
MLNVRHSAGNGAINQSRLIAVCRVPGVNRSTRELAHDTGYNYNRLDTGPSAHQLDTKRMPLI